MGTASRGTILISLIQIFVRFPSSPPQNPFKCVNEPVRLGPVYRGIESYYLLRRRNWFDLLGVKFWSTGQKKKKPFPGTSYN